ncbi:unnamed protein product, partial [Ectocarpus sp. 13 AM-2016]
FCPRKTFPLCLLFCRARAGEAMGVIPKGLSFLVVMLCCRESFRELLCVCPFLFLFRRMRANKMGRKRKYEKTSRPRCFLAGLWRRRQLCCFLDPRGCMLRGAQVFGPSTFHGGGASSSGRRGAGGRCCCVGGLPLLVAAFRIA